MSQAQAGSDSGRLSRRAALRTGAAIGGAGAGLAVGLVGGKPAANAAGDVDWQSERLEMDLTPADPVSIVRADGGTPMRGDTFYMDGALYAKDDAGGRQTGMYHAFGVWTHDATDSEAPYQLLVNVQFRLFGTGSIMGMVNGGGTEPAGHEGAIQGGTGQYAGAQGTFRQRVISEAPTLVVRAAFDMLLPKRD